MAQPCALAQRVSGAFAHLRHAAGGAGELVAVNRLNRVNHRHGGLPRGQRGHDFFKLDFSQHRHLRASQPQPARAQRHLRAAFFARHVKRRHARALQGIQRLEQQRGFANARIAAHEHHAAGDDTAAQRAIQLGLARGRARHVLRLNAGQRLHV